MIGGELLDRPLRLVQPADQGIGPLLQPTDDGGTIVEALDHRGDLGELAGQGGNLGAELLERGVHLRQLGGAERDLRQQGGQGRALFARRDDQGFELAPLPLRPAAPGPTLQPVKHRHWFLPLRVRGFCRDHCRCRLQVLHSGDLGVVHGLEIYGHYRLFRQGGPFALPGGGD